eukprot:Gb_18511 [translate_table: standard]
MKLLSWNIWNIRWLASPSKKRALKFMMKKESPEILFLQETNLSSKLMMDLVKTSFSGFSVQVVDVKD